MGNANAYRTDVHLGSADNHNASKGQIPDRLEHNAELSEQQEDSKMRYETTSMPERMVLET